ncbi:MAG: hypothetical protein ACK5HP_04930 [Bacilli bacterium]
MNNFIIALKRFFKNKNTITILGVMAIILILFLGYRFQINKMVSPVTGIPVAAQVIQPRTEITADMLEYIDVAPIVLQSNVITNSANIIGKYSNYNTVIPAGSLFYTDVVVKEEDLPDAAFVELADGEVPYNLPVTMDTTYGNSICPGNYIDIYLKAVNENGELMVGKLVENIKVLAVKDSSGRNVFENSEESRIPSTLIFGITDEINILLRKASYMSEYGAVLFPVPHGSNVSTDGATFVSSQTLKDFINANTVPNDEISSETTTG